MKRWFLLFSFGFAFCFPLISSAQDKLLTQAFAHPVDLNPAYSGDVAGRYRVSLAYRDQWRSIIESPFTTMAIYGDLKIIPDKQKDDYFGAGFSLLTDRTAILNINQNMLSLYGSYHKALNKDQGQYLSAGMNVGVAQRNVNYENVYFNDQFNGLDQYSLGTAENLPNNNFAFMDMGLGVRYSSSASKYSSFSFGFSVDHLIGNSISFYKHSLDDETYVLLPDSKIDRKLTGYLSMEISSNELIAFLPRLLWQVQGPHQMIAAAGLVKFDLTNYNNSAFHIGGGVRLNQTSSTGLKPSAVYILTAYEVKGLLIGLSHDILVNNLNEGHTGKGAFELSISFTGFYENDDSICPSF
ncbi:MAG: PorP/SprF family type IX secretion system membrane protein [Saprospiraceae bacterium]|uniref:PorP/SprF family type IX secretion system membrane protein n=1 Tax=Candidatus Opimibacter skivensis TaxID=2982028 RepID=A0A9D7SYU6_9BACT|nr:PorP/SprF family type IX secretion system membrane protein [Candidatus Opimibacter skivensis]